MKRIIETLLCVMLAAGAAGCSDDNDRLDYMEGATSVWIGAKETIDMSNFGSQLAVRQGNIDVAKATVDGSNLVIDGVSVGRTMMYVTTDRIFLQMLVRVKGLVGYWGVLTNDKYGIGVDVVCPDQSRAEAIEAEMFTIASEKLAGSNFEFGNSLYDWNNGTDRKSGSWQLTGSALTLTTDGVARTVAVEVVNTDLLQVTADITAEAQLKYPADGITAATVTFYLARRIIL